MVRINTLLKPQLNRNVGIVSNTRASLMLVPKDYNEMSGRGILDSIRSLMGKMNGDVGAKMLNLIPSSDETARPVFAGEKHALLKLPNGKMGIANYMGPGTQLVKRLKRGDPPRTETDKVSQAHDIRYGIAKNVDDIRKADKIMIRKVEEIARNKTDSRLNIAQAKLIKAKIVGENLGLIKRDAFSGDLSNNQLLPQGDIALMNDKLKSLSMKGYGKSPAYELKKKILRKANQMKLAVVPLKGMGQDSSITPYLSTNTTAKDLFQSPVSSVAKMLSDLGIHGAKKLALPLAGLVLAKKSAKLVASKVLPWLKRKLFRGKGKMSGKGITKKQDDVLLKHLEDAIIKTRDYVKKGQSGKGLKLSGSGFFSGFVNVLKKIAKPALKAGLAGLSIVQPELAIPLGIAGSLI